MPEPRRQASLRILADIPGEWLPSDMESLTDAVIAAINSSPARVVDIRWACPGLGQPRAYRAKPLVFFPPREEPH